MKALKILYLISITFFLFHDGIGYYEPGQCPEVIRALYNEIEPWTYVDFDIGMQLACYPQAIQITKTIVGVDGNELLGLCRYLYNKYNLSCMTIQATPIIPKILHQIWIGGPVPEAFKKYMATWVHYHMGRDWKYKLWTDEDVKEFPLYNRAFYNESDNYGVKSDILKWEIVYQLGGVYVDTDFECFKPLDILNHTYDFYTALQPLDTQYVQLGAALFAGKPGDPILRHCIETVKDDWHKKGAPAKTGPVHFTKSFFAVANQEGYRAIAFPANYFYPLGCRENEDDRYKWIEEGAWGVHWWSKSWMPAKYRPAQFKKLDNDKSCESWNS